MIDKLEIDLFFAACARRLAKKTGIRIAPNRIGEMLRLYNTEGEMLKGRASEYHSTVFDWGTPEDESINNQVVGGDLINRSRGEVRIILVATAA
jgi:hypothetical protein